MHGRYVTYLQLKKQNQQQQYQDNENVEESKIVILLSTNWKSYDILTIFQLTSET